MSNRFAALRLSSLAAACALACAAPQAGAQDARQGNAAAAGDVQALQEVRVYGTAEKDTGFAPTQIETAGKMPMKLIETPMAISVVTREQMESRQAGNLQEALETVAGVSPVNYGRRGFDDLFIRGFDSGESTIIDGLAQSGNSSIGLRLQQYGYERFEVLKGASSLLYGRVQPGGMVNAISKRPRREALGEVHLEAGSYGNRVAAFDINRPLSASGRAALRINALAGNKGDPTDHVWRHDRWFAPSLSLDLGADTDFVIFATYNAGKWIRQQGLPPQGTVLPNRNGPLRHSLFTGDPGFGPYDLKQYTLGYNLQHRFANNMTLRQNLRYEEESGTGRFIALQTLRPDERTQTRRGTHQELDDNQIAIDTSMLMPFETGGISHQLVAGLDMRKGRNSRAQHRCTIGPIDLYAPTYGQSYRCPNKWDTDAPTHLSTAALYVQDQIKFGRGWTALGGLRYEKSRMRQDNRINNTSSSQRDSDITGMAGVVYEFTPGWSVYGSYSQSFLPQMGQDFAGNLFKPEKGVQWELGSKFVRDGWTASAALFDLRKRNIAASDPLHEGYSVLVGEQRARGLELEAGADLKNGLKLTAAYAYTKTEVTRSTNASEIGQPLNYTPRHALSLWANWRLPQLPALTIGAGLRHVSKQQGNLAFHLPAYTVADASIAYTGSHWRLSASVKNLFDRRYYAGAVRTGVISPGMPRNFNVTLKYFF